MAKREWLWTTPSLRTGSERRPDQGNAIAQWSLGSAYEHGHGVTQDYVVAHMWLNLAAAQGDGDASKERDHLAQYMTPDQIAEAQRLAREWKPSSR
jgi:uncharacterized protein